MAKFGPKPGSTRPHQWRGSKLACVHCSAEFYAFPSAAKRGKKYCSSACYMAAKQAQKKTICAACQNAPRVEGQAYCAPCGLAKNEAWRRANRPEQRPRTNLRAMTPAERLEYKRAYGRKWRAENKQQIAMWNRLRRHRERAGGEMPDSYDVSWLLCKQDARCAYCLTLFVPGAPFELDHILPVSRGGSNDLENIQLVCPTCNMRKGAKTDEEFIAKLAEMTLARLA